MTEKYIPLITTLNGSVLLKKYRTAVTSAAGQYNLRVGNQVPANRSTAGATVPMPTLVTSNDISTNGFKLVINGGQYRHEVSIDGNIVAITKDNEIIISGIEPDTSNTLSVVAVRDNGEYSQAYTVTIRTKPEQNLYPYKVGDVDPVRIVSGTLLAPSQVSLSYIDTASVRVSWSPPSDAVTGGAMYEVVLNGFIVSLTSETYVDIAGLVDAVYIGKVRVINNRNEYSDSAQETQPVPASVAVALPTGQVDKFTGDYGQG